MNDIIKESLSRSFTYSEYRNTVVSLLKEGKSTGHVQSTHLLHYTELNQTRMNRLNKTIVISEDIAHKLQTLKSEYIWLVISEGWCGDAAQLLPIFNKMENLSDKIEMKIVLRDDNPELMRLFLTNGGKSIPKLIILDKETLNILADWGPRPKGAAKLLTDYKEEVGFIDEAIKNQLQLWYLKDKGLSTQKEIAELLS